MARIEMVIISIVMVIKITKTIVEIMVLEIFVADETFVATTITTIGEMAKIEM